ncbi:MAG: hypothetical protein ACE5MI_07560, partial [Acidimicrobiia bacterium]
MTREDPARSRYLPLVVALVALGAGGLVVGRGLQVYGGNPAGFLRFSTQAPIPYDQASLGEVPLVEDAGHDGKFYFLQAHDPFLLDAETAAMLDPPLYRAQRVLYPLLAAPSALVSDRALAWTMIGINLLALVVGTWATARLAIALGGSPWLGLAFGLNIGLLFELMIDGSGIVAWALGVLGVWAAVSGRLGWASVAVTGAVLAREVMILVAVGLFVGLWVMRRHRAWSVLLVPFGAAGLWAVWIRLQTGGLSLETDVPAVGPPLQGIIQAVEAWLSGEGDALMGLAVLAVVLVVAWQAAPRPGLVSWAVVGFSVLAMFLSELVWTN